MSDRQTMVIWLVLENITILTIAFLGCYFLTGWWSLLILGLNTSSDIRKVIE